MIDVVIDAMGGDHAPERPVAAAVEVAKTDGLSIGLVGHRDAIARALKSLGARNPPNISIHHAEESIAMDEKPSAAVRKKKNSSLRVAAELVKVGEAKAMVSAGNSGAVMAAGLFVIGRVPGVQRPALTTTWPTMQQPVVLLDLGANIDPTPAQLAQFGIMGEAYARVVLGRSLPKVGLLANGSEEHKGTELTRGAHEILSRANIDFRGYVEGRDVFGGGLDVIVTDGFTGNVLLKTLEGFVDAVGTIVKTEINASLLNKIGALLMQRFLSTLKQRLDYETVGAVPLLGLKQPVLIAHGGSTVKALAYAIRRAAANSEKPLADAIESSILEASPVFD